MGEKTIYTCDCCGIESERNDFYNGGSQLGSSKLKITGNHGSEYNGGWGGASHNIEEFICFSCSESVRKFYSEFKESCKEKTKPLD